MKRKKYTKKHIGRVVFTFALFLFILSSFPINAVALSFKDDSTKSLILNNKDLTPLDILRGDTVKKKIDIEDYDAMPGAVGFRTNMYQDSNYIRALRLKIPLSARLANDLRMFAPQLPSKSDRTSRVDQINNALNLPPEYYLPLPVDMANYQYNLLMSQNTVTGIRTMNPFGLKISLSSIGRLLGITEDVSPVITYELNYTTEVEVVIYSIAATVAATIFEGVQKAGRYTYTWNGRNDMGRKLPPGDYIAEIRIGKERYIRKRIVIR